MSRDPGTLLPDRDNWGWWCLISDNLDRKLVPLDSLLEDKLSICQSQGSQGEAYTLPCLAFCPKIYYHLTTNLGGSTIS